MRLPWWLCETLREMRETWSLNVLEAPYARYCRRCVDHGVKPLHYDEYVRQGGVMDDFDSATGPPRYPEYCRRCRQSGVEPLPYDECRPLLGERAAVPAHCPDCGYDLTGNVSRRCPECGRYLY